MRLLDAAPWVLPHVIGCPDPVLEHHLRASTQRLCAQAGVWMETDDGQPVTASTPEYDIELPSRDAALIRIRTAWLDGAPLQHCRADDMQTLAQGPARGFLHRAGSLTLHLIGQPANGQTLQIRTVLTPAHTARTIPDGLAEQHMAAIAAGAISSLMLLPGQTWSNPALGVAHAQEAARLLDDARLCAIKDGTDSTQHVRKRRFA